MDSIDSIIRVETELDRYFVWLARFEASIPRAQDAIAMPYTSPLLQAHMGCSWFKASTPGKPALCLANIIVADGTKGQKDFATLIERFLDGRDGSEARVLYLENIARPRLGYRLLRVGFQRCAHGTGEFSAYYLER